MQTAPKRYHLANIDDLIYVSIGDIKLGCDLTEYMISATKRGGGQKQINFDKMPGRFPEGTFARIDAVLQEKEKRADLLREAVERELKRRERQSRSSSTSTSSDDG